MCHNTLDLIWAIWGIYRSKGFEAIKAGNWTFVPGWDGELARIVNTLMDEPCLIYVFKTYDLMYLSILQPQTENSMTQKKYHSIEYCPFRYIQQLQIRTTPIANNRHDLTNVYIINYLTWKRKHEAVVSKT